MQVLVHVGVHGSVPIKEKSKDEFRDGNMLNCDGSCNMCLTYCPTSLLRVRVGNSSGLGFFD